MTELRYDEPGKHSPQWGVEFVMRKAQTWGRNGDWGWGSVGGVAVLPVGPLVVPKIVLTASKNWTVHWRCLPEQQHYRDLSLRQIERAQTGSWNPSTASSGQTCEEPYSSWSWSWSWSSVRARICVVKFVLMFSERCDEVRIRCIILPTPHSASKYCKAGLTDCGGAYAGSSETGREYRTDLQPIRACCLCNQTTKKSFYNVQYRYS